MESHANLRLGFKVNRFYMGGVIMPSYYVGLGTYWVESRVKVIYLVIQGSLLELQRGRLGSTNVKNQ